MKKRVTYIRGYNHYDYRRKHRVTILMRAAEYEYFRDALAAMGRRNQSDFVRECIFAHLNRTLTTKERERLQEVADWRAEED